MKKLAICFLCALTITTAGCGSRVEVASSAEPTVAVEETKSDSDESTKVERTEAGADTTQKEENNQDKGDAIFLDGLSVSWADDRKSDLSDYEEIDISYDEYSKGILFIAIEDVNDFKLYEMAMTDVHPDGTPVFSRSRVFATDQILSQMPMIFNVSFPGDMSAYGFSYTHNGIEKNYSIMVSGMDGSLIVEEMDLGYPDDTITLKFTSESPYNPDDYHDIATQGTASEKDTDYMMESISDMLSAYQCDDSDMDVAAIYGNSITQEFYQNLNHGTKVVHTVAWTGDELLDPVMKKVGYKEYEVNYYYPFGLWIFDEATVVKPVYVCLYIDGNGYEYYFDNDELVRRNGPEGVTINPKTNDFINHIYKIGCYYGNNLVGEKDRYSITVSSSDSIEKKGDSFVLTGNIMGRNQTGSFVIDKNTVFDKDFDGTGLQGLKKGEAFYDWYCRAYDAIENQEDWIEVTTMLGIWDVKTTGGHVDYICGSYWWD